MTVARRARRRRRADEGGIAAACYAGGREVWRPSQTTTLTLILADAASRKLPHERPHRAATLAPRTASPSILRFGRDRSAPCPRSSASPGAPRGGAFCAGLELEERAGVLIVVRPARSCRSIRRFDGWKWSAARAAMIALGWKGRARRLAPVLRGCQDDGALAAPRRASPRRRRPPSRAAGLDLADPVGERLPAE